MRRGRVRDNVAHVQSNYKSLVNVGTTGERERSPQRRPVGGHVYLYLLRVEIKRIVKLKVLHNFFFRWGGDQN